MPHAILREMAHLQWLTPRPDASPAAVADWYERKAALFEHIAADSPAQRVEALRQARLAHQHAHSLIKGTAA